MEKIENKFSSNPKQVYLNKVKNSLPRLISALHFKKTKKNCDFCKQKTRISQNFLVLSKKHLNFVGFEIQKEKFLKPLDYFLLIPQRFNEQELFIKNDSSDKNDSEFELIGLITRKSGKTRCFLKYFAENDEGFKEIGGEKSLSWLRLWKEIVNRDEKPKFLLYIQ